MMNPCSECDDREVLCHSKCEKYKEFRKALDDRNISIRKARKEANLKIFYYKKNKR